MGRRVDVKSTRKVPVLIRCRNSPPSFLHRDQILLHTLAKPFLRRRKMERVKAGPSFWSAHDALHDSTDRRTHDKELERERERVDRRVSSNEFGQVIHLYMYQILVPGVSQQPKLYKCILKILISYSKGCSCKALHLGTVYLGILL